MDDIDRALIQRLQDDAGQSYAALAASVGLSAGATHERVRKLRERGSSGGPRSRWIRRPSAAGSWPT